MDTGSEHTASSTDCAAALNEARIYKKIDELLFRIMQLEEITRVRGALNPEKARDLRKKTRRAQERLDRLYAALDE